jgi:hypothetical protein
MLIESGHRGIPFEYDVPCGKADVECLHYASIGDTVKMFAPRSCAQR